MTEARLKLLERKTREQIDLSHSELRELILEIYRLRAALSGISSGATGVVDRDYVLADRARNALNWKSEVKQ